MEYSWPGNIRQLRNALRTASALCRDGIIRLLEPASGDSRHRAPAPPARGPSGCAGDRGGGRRCAAESSPSAALREAECAALLRELERMRWNISRTAQTLGISRNTLYRKIHKHSIVLEH